jgi:hypothetical protein
MPEEVVQTEQTPSVPIDQGGSPPPATDTPNPLEARLVELEGRLNSVNDEVVKRDALIQHYQQALGTQRAAPPTPAPDASSKFDPETVQFVNAQAEHIATREINKAVAKLTLQAQAQQRLGNDPEMTKTAQTVFAEFQNNPHYRGQSEEILMALAATEAEARVNKSRYERQKTDYQKLQADTARRSQAEGASLPATTNRPPQYDASDPDADIKGWMADANNQLMARKFLRATAGRDIDPNSTEKVRWYGKDVPANDIFKQTAIRAVRIGVGLSERMRGAFEPAPAGGTR